MPKAPVTTKPIVRLNRSLSTSTTSYAGRSRAHRDPCRVHASSRTYRMCLRCIRLSRSAKCAFTCVTSTDNSTVRWHQRHQAVRPCSINACVLPSASVK